MNESLGKINGLCYFYGTRGKELDLALYWDFKQMTSLFYTSIYPFVKLD